MDVGGRSTSIVSAFFDRNSSAGEIRRIKVTCRLSVPEDALNEDDEILDQATVSPYFAVYNVLAKPKQTYSALPGRKLYARWESTQRVDRDSAEEYFRFLRDHDLHRIPPGSSDIKMLDIFGAAPNPTFRSK